MKLIITERIETLKLPLYKKLKLFHYISIIISLITILLITLYCTATYSIFSEDLNIIPYTAEPEEEGYSQVISCTSDGNGLLFKANLGLKAETPIAGVIIEPKNKTWIDLSSYKNILIYPNRRCSNFNMTLTLFEEGFSNLEESDTHRYLQLESVVSNNDTPISVELRSLPTPVFWYLMNKTNRENFPNIDLSKVSSLIFSNHPATPKGSTLNIHLDSILFTRSKLPIIVTIIIIIIFWIIVISYHVITHKKINVVIAAQPNSEKRPLYSEIINTILNELQNPDLTLKDVAFKIGIPVSRIKKILQEEEGTTFSIVLQEQRLIQAATLLKNPKLDIKEISHKVGFSHPSSFSRAFKNKYGIIPSEFREKS